MEPESGTTMLASLATRRGYIAADPSRFTITSASSDSSPAAPSIAAAATNKPLSSSSEFPGSPRSPRAIDGLLPPLGVVRGPVCGDAPGALLPGGPRRREVLLPVVPVFVVVSPLLAARQVDGGVHADELCRRSGVAGPGVTPAKPEYTPGTPEYTPSTPEYTPGTPEYTPSTPEYTPESPLRRAGAPEYTTSTPPPAPLVSDAELRAPPARRRHHPYQRSQTSCGRPAATPEYTPSTPPPSPPVSNAESRTSPARRRHHPYQRCHTSCGRRHRAFFSLHGY
ncbi:hypothetical protein PVAP13_7KG161755 [Panicum virgatum]|uniref:Uncharacterized protein n=1 Tax=Panicum virgatum TaxID=38727 RepID=A0A8T0QEL9_PANVG|nr:hypothetical protein PVAP13_7KG161755 [Panicum virgatum]